MNALESAQTATPFREFEYPLLIQERHLDTFRHVNNATYLEIFEEARWDFITKNGFGLREIQESEVGPIILEAGVRFQRELTNRQEVGVIIKGGACAVGRDPHRAKRMTRMGARYL